MPVMLPLDGWAYGAISASYRLLPECRFRSSAAQALSFQFLVSHENSNSHELISSFDSFPLIVALELWLRISYSSSTPLYGFLFSRSFRPFVIPVLVKNLLVRIPLLMPVPGRLLLLQMQPLWSLLLSRLFRWLYCCLLVFSVSSRLPLCRLSCPYVGALRMVRLLILVLPPLRL